MIKLSTTFSEYNAKLTYYLYLLLAFCIPIHKKILPFVIAILILNWLLGFNFKSKFNSVIHNRSLLVLITLYVFYLIGIIYSKDLSYAENDIAVKASFVIFPIILCESFLLPLYKIKNIFFIFIIGCFSNCIVQLIHAFIMFKQTHSKDEFFYNELSWSFHPAYYAMYICFIITLLIYYLFFDGSFHPKKQKVLATALVIFFSIYIILLNSKAGIISLGLLYFISLIYYFIRFKKLILIFSVALGIGGSFFAFQHYLINPINPRLELAKENIEIKHIDSTTTESTNARILVWKASLEIINDNYLFGVGTGDVKDVLLAKYKEKGMTGAFNEQLNSHNQFLQTFIALGIPGFLLLLSIFVFPIINSFKTKNYILFCFLLIVFLNFLTESMLETISGVVFFAFFYSLLIANNNRKELLFKQ